MSDNQVTPKSSVKVGHFQLKKSKYDIYIYIFGRCCTMTLRKTSKLDNYRSAVIMIITDSKLRACILPCTWKPMKTRTASPSKVRAASISMFPNDQWWKYVKINFNYTLCTVNPLVVPLVNLFFLLRTLIPYPPKITPGLLRSDHLLILFHFRAISGTNHAYFLYIDYDQKSSKLQHAINLRSPLQIFVFSSKCTLNFLSLLKILHMSTYNSSEISFVCKSAEYDLVWEVSKYIVTAMYQGIGLILHLSIIKTILITERKYYRRCSFFQIFFTDSIEVCDFLQQEAFP